MEDVHSSFAGSWGLEQRQREEQRRIMEGTLPPRRSERFLTETKLKYSAQDTEALRKSQESKYGKFRSLQRNGSAILATSQEPATDDLSRPMSRAELEQAESVRISTTFRDSYLPPDSSNAENQSIPFEFHRTNSKILHSPEAPVAKGRSGMRIEHGVMTSGLSGERLMLTVDPRQNSLCQRAWLYTQDPALTVKLQGRPTLEISPDIAQLSLQVGEESLSKKADRPHDFGRKFIVTGGVLTKTGYSRSGIFMDDNDTAIVQSVRMPAKKAHDQRMELIRAATASYQSIRGFKNTPNEQ